MWTSHSNQIAPDTIRFTLSHESDVLSYRHVIDLWQTGGKFREFFTQTITDCSFEAFFWETPPVTNQTWDGPFEFVLVESSSLSRLKPDSSQFKSYFSSQPSEMICTFPNLGGDALLVVPKPLANESCYTHLARFLRDSPKPQIDALWRTVGEAMNEGVSNSPIWLSTAGMGVSWLHLRLDSRPKYYRHEPYKVAS